MESQLDSCVDFSAPKIWGRCLLRALSLGIWDYIFAYTPVNLGQSLVKSTQQFLALFHMFVRLACLYTFWFTHSIDRIRPTSKVDYPRLFSSSPDFALISNPIWPDDMVVPNCLYGRQTQFSVLERINRSTFAEHTIQPIVPAVVDALPRWKRTTHQQRVTREVNISVFWTPDSLRQPSRCLLM